MGFQIIFIIAVILVGLWVLGGAFSLASTQKARKEKAAQTPRPELRMADQWLRSSQAQLESLMERMEAPLGSAQHELLELRLEAGRVPEGMKSIATVREQLTGSLQPALRAGTLRETIGFYLKEGEFISLPDEWIVLKTPQGDIPCFQALSAWESLTDESIQAICLKPSRNSQNLKVEFFLAFFPETEPIRQIQESSNRSKLFQESRITPVDIKGLTALLISLRLHHDVLHILGSFEEGVRSTQALVGQADRMASIMGKLNADTVRARIILDGGDSPSLTGERPDPPLESKH